MTTARASHRTVANREMHEKMSFHDGWGKATLHLQMDASSIVRMLFNQ